MYICRLARSGFVFMDVFVSHYTQYNNIHIIYHVWHWSCMCMLIFMSSTISSQNWVLNTQWLMLITQKEYAPNRAHRSTDCVENALQFHLARSTSWKRKRNKTILCSWNVKKKWNEMNERTNERNISSDSYFTSLQIINSFHSIVESVFGGLLPCKSNHFQTILRYVNVYFTRSLSLPLSSTFCVARSLMNGRAYTLQLLAFEMYALLNGFEHCTRAQNDESDILQIYYYRN